MDDDVETNIATIAPTMAIRADKNMPDLACLPFETVVGSRFSFMLLVEEDVEAVAYGDSEFLLMVLDKSRGHFTNV